MKSNRVLLFLLLISLFLMSTYIYLNHMIYVNKKIRPNISKKFSYSIAPWTTYQFDGTHSGRFPSKFSAPNSSIILSAVPVEIKSETYAVTGDFDQDGYFEIAVPSCKNVYIIGYMGIEDNISFGAEVSHITSLDYDNDSAYELAIASGNSIYLYEAGCVQILMDLKKPISAMVPINTKDGQGLLIGTSKLYIWTLKGGLKEILNSPYINPKIKYITIAKLNSQYEIIVAIETKDGFVVSALAEESFKVLWSIDVGYIRFPPMAFPSSLGKEAANIILAYYKDYSSYILILDTYGNIYANISFYGITIEGFSSGDLDSDGKLEVYVSYYNDTSKSYDVGRLDLRNGRIIRIIKDANSIPVIAKIDSDMDDDLLIVIDGYLSIYANGSIIKINNKELKQVGILPLTITDLDNDSYIEVGAFLEYWGIPKFVVYRTMPKIKYSEVKPPSKFQKIIYEISKYHKSWEIYEIIDWIIGNYSSRTSKTVIGKSFDKEGKLSHDILCIKITNGDGKDKPAILIIGAHHARELITAEASIYLAVYLAEGYDYDIIVKKLLDNFDVYIIPVLNVGGHDYAFEFEWQRGNLRPVDSDGDDLINEDPPYDKDGDGYIKMILFWDYKSNEWKFLGYEGDDKDGDGLTGEDPYGGVDLNRNYAYDWSSEGEYGNPSSEIYAGNNPLSEPETKALDDFMRNLRPLLALSLHSGEETIFFSWSIGYKVTYDYELITRLAYIGQIASNLPALLASSIYESHGSWDDHAYGCYGILAFTPEIFRNDSWPKTISWDDDSGIYCAYYGVKWLFNPFPNKIIDVDKKVTKMFIAMAMELLDIIKQDSNPPSYIINFEGTDGKIKLIVKAWDSDSGVWDVFALADGELFDLNIDFSTGEWVGIIERADNITILVIDRAGNKASGAIKISYHYSLNANFIT